MPDQAIERRFEINKTLQELSDYWHDHPTISLIELVGFAGESLTASGFPTDDERVRILLSALNSEEPRA